jgi:hypothetical protein
LGRSMTSANASGKVVVDSCGGYMFMSLCSLAFRIGEMRLPSGTWNSTESKEVGWEVISNAPVGTASRSELIGWVV